ncbi:MCP four helix bundle domain-containing protein [Rhodoferax sp. AJA081-3]|uniref:MCP four helix bundle domain-containing protein n=1 Tax=Rhodoferax sp. AJA081-3 TaxID=2752316 RepID=UPI001FD7F225|nr:MCP four helix bundle domain-containing protein [Rhodoferax sp. AJA081-3]
MFSLFQMGRLNTSTSIIYEQEYTAGQAAEQVRSNILRASRAQTQLLTSSTAAERDALAKDVEASLAEVGKKIETIQGLSNTDESKETAKQLVEAIAKWSKRLREYVKLVKEQPLSFMELSPDVASEDAGLVNETRKVEKIVDAMVAQRGQSAQATMTHAGEIYKTSLVWVIGIVLLLIAVSIGVGSWVIARLTRQLGGEPAYAKSIASRIADGDLTMEIQLAANDTQSLLYSLHEMQTRLAETMGRSPTVRPRWPTPRAKSPWVTWTCPTVPNNRPRRWSAPPPMWSNWQPLPSGMPTAPPAPPNYRVLPLRPRARVVRWWPMWCRPWKKSARARWPSIPILAPSRALPSRPISWR